MDINALVRKSVLSLTPYSSARDEGSGIEAETFLDANENPFPTQVNRYPDPYQSELKARLSELKGINPKNLLIGNGSDEVLDLLYRAFCNPGQDNVVAIQPSYGMYNVLASINDVEIRFSQLDSEFQLNISDLMDQVNASTKLIFLCSPNNPTGNNLDSKSILEVARRFKGLVVVDEAYIDFSLSPSIAEFQRDHPNIVVSQTLSKAWGLASMRLGLCIAHTDVISVLNRIKPPYNVSGLVQKEALKMLDQHEKKLSQVKSIIAEREKLEQGLVKLGIVLKIWASSSNFLLVQFRDSEAVFNYLKSSEILVRNRSGEVGCFGCLRITVGTPKENNKLMEKLMEFKI